MCKCSNEGTLATFYFIEMKFDIKHGIEINKNCLFTGLDEPFSLKSDSYL